MVNGKSGLGRDHNHWGFSVWLAGGGVKGGTVHGATDEFGYKAVENIVHVHDLHATILHLLGFDHTHPDLPLRRPGLPADRRARRGGAGNHCLRRKPLHGDAGVNDDIDDCGSSPPSFRSFIRRDPRGSMLHIAVGLALELTANSIRKVPR